ncbi:SVM family protein [Candidatus Phytoplasma gossypii]|uniref:SVM family protein n=1 Tax=Candidatus Phytoplasma gossypii TaxID=2982629 RepID=A0ABT9D215_9MOLU|nr:SVM family protein ['Gossypium sp.' phytoplasma]MDO8057335.1 SVM family protein ['Gossypium sp.' phytoplasma]
MFTLKNYSKIIIIYLLICSGILFIFHNNKVIAMGNKHSHNKEISNDKEYDSYIKAEYIIQNELTHFKLNNEKQAELLNRQNSITTEINKYNNKQKNNQLLTTCTNQPESSRQNIIDTIENNYTNSSDNNLQYMNLRKNSSNILSIDRTEPIFCDNF